MKKLRIAHLSDPHFGTVRPEVHRSLQTMIQELEPDLIAVSGDLTQRAHPVQFRAAREFFKSLEPIPLLAVPGNHDIALYNVFSRLFFPYRNFHRFLRCASGDKVSMQGVDVLALNSTSRFRFVQGRLRGTALQRRLSQDFADSEMRVVIFHHPLGCPKRVDTKNILRNSREVVKMLEAHRVDLVLGGHIHDPYVSLSHETYPGVERSAVIAVGGTCLSWRTRADAPNSFNWIEITMGITPGPSLRISRYDMQKDHKFRSICQEEFLRHEDFGWQRVQFPTKEAFDPGDRSEEYADPTL